MKTDKTPYKQDHPKQAQLREDVAFCAFNTVISPTALTNRCFDRLIKNQDPQLTVSCFAGIFAWLVMERSREGLIDQLVRLLIGQLID